MGDLETKPLGELIADAKAHHDQALEWAREETAQCAVGTHEGRDDAVRRQRRHSQSLREILNAFGRRFGEPPKPDRPTRECGCCGNPMSPPEGGHAWNFARCRKCVELLVRNETACGFHETHLCGCRQQRADDRESFMGAAHRAAEDYKETE